MPIGGSATELNITGAKLKVSGGVQVAGSIAYTTEATGFGSVTAQIDNNNTLNITSGKNTGVAKIDRTTAATITAINHTNVNNNTTIHIALKNTSSANGSNGGIFITLGTFSNDDNIKVNYTDDYVISPQETGMITLRKVNNVLSVFIREMFTTDSKTFDSTKNRPFYAKDGINYKYPLYTAAFPNAVTSTIGGTQYYVRSTDNGGVISKSRPPKGLPENVIPPSGTLKIGNTASTTTINYDVYGTGSTAEAGSLYKGSTQKIRFVLDTTLNEASGSFTDSSASSGDTYTLYLDKNATTSTDTTSITVLTNQTLYIAFHHGTFSSSDYSSAYANTTAAADAGFVYSDTVAGDYWWGTLGTPTLFATGTSYTWTSADTLTGVDVLMVAGGGGGGGHVAGGGGAGGLLHHTGQSLSGAKTIVIGAGGAGGASETDAYSGSNTNFTGFDNAIGGGRASNYDPSAPASDGGSGGGGGHGGAGGSGTSGQGNAGASSSDHSHSGGGGGAGGAGTEAHGGSGGAGLDKSSVFGTTYGESGWFAGGGGGGARTTGSDGPGGQGGGGDGSNQTNENGDNGMKHTGGGGGGNGTGSGTSGTGGSGIVLIKYTGDKVTSMKKIPKVNDITLDPTNDSNVLISTQGTGISTVTYSVNGGSEVSTPVSQLSVAHGLGEAITGTLLAYALNASSARLGVKLSKSITTPYGYETITLLTKSGSQTITYVDNGTTNVTNTYKSAGGDTWNGGWYMDTGYTAPVTFEYKASASSSDDGNSYKQIGINDAIVQTYASADFDIYNYPYYQSAFYIDGNNVTGETVATSWNSTDTFYIVYKTNGDVEWWQAGTKFKTVSWGTGKTVYLSTTLHKQGNGSDNGSFKNIRIKRRQWDGTKYIN